MGDTWADQQETGFKTKAGRNLRKGGQERRAMSSAGVKCDWTKSEMKILDLTV